VRELSFTKMHGIGNDFVVADFVTEAAEARPPYTEDELQQASVFLCDRKFGVGGDGLVLILPGTTGTDFTMRMFNPDGSEAEMCGNAIRCVAKYVYERNYTDKATITVNTLGGVKTLDLKLAADRSVAQVTVDMGKPGLDRADLPMTGGPGRVIAEPIDVAGKSVAITGVSMGNPHVIYFESPVTEESINTLGPQLEKHPLFSAPDQRALGRDHQPRRDLHADLGARRGPYSGLRHGRLRLRRRGAFERLYGRRVLVHLAGGDLLIEWEENGPVYMTGRRRRCSRRGLCCRRISPDDQGRRRWLSVNHWRVLRL